MRTVRSLLLVVLFAMLLLASLGASIQAYNDTSRASLNAVQPPIVQVAQEAPASAHVQSIDRQSVDVQVEPNLRIISIPIGFDLPLLLDDVGQNVQVSGQVGCTADETVTIVVTLTQTSTTAIATGQTQETCTGEFQKWGTRATTTGSIPLTTAPAEACGLITTAADGNETDRVEWCSSVDFFHGKFLPFIVHTE